MSQGVQSARGRLLFLWRRSLPFDRGGRLARDVVDDSVDAAHFVDDAVRHLAEEVVREVAPVGRHEVGRFDRAQAHDPFVGAAVAHDAHGLHREEDHEGLAHLVVEAGVAEFFDEDRVGFTEKVGVFALHFAEDAHAQTRTREGVTVDHFSGKAEFDAEFADFVLEEVAQRFEELQVKRVGKTAHVVVRLDGLRLLRLGAGGFDDVRYIRRRP